MPRGGRRPRSYAELLPRKPRTPGTSERQARTLREAYGRQSRGGQDYGGEGAGAQPTPRSRAGFSF